MWKSPGDPLASSLPFRWEHWGSERVRTCIGCWRQGQNPSPQSLLWTYSLLSCLKLTKVSYIFEEKMLPHTQTQKWSQKKLNMDRAVGEVSEEKVAVGRRVHREALREKWWWNIQVGHTLRLPKVGQEGHIRTVSVSHPHSPSENFSEITVSLSSQSFILGLDYSSCNILTCHCHLSAN